MEFRPAVTMRPALESLGESQATKLALVFTLLASVIARFRMLQAVDRLSFPHSGPMREAESCQHRPRETASLNLKNGAAVERSEYCLLSSKATVITDPDGFPWISCPASG
jgi:hypothetical protein